MITNERQYKITKAHAKKFEDALTDFDNVSNNANIDPMIVKAQKKAMASQLEDLRAELSEYESLQSGKQKVIELRSFDEFPQALIKARISQGLSQKELAERLGLKEQQIQRYESTGYNSASLGRIMEVIDALKLEIRKDIFLPGAELSLGLVFTKLNEIGLKRDFISKFIPRSIANKIDDNFESKDETVVYQIMSILRRVFGWSLNELISTKPLTVESAINGAARFKVSANAAESFVSVYTVYAHYLALLVLDATAHLPKRSIPSDPAQVYKEVINYYGVLTFETMLRYVWDLGVAVLPLKDSGAFHGACWRVNGRNVIVLKQRTNFDARWLFDLCHELWHAGQDPEKSELNVIELGETSKERRESDEEQQASQFAGDILLNGRAEELADLCVREANGRVEYLKSALPKVALREGVSVELVANYMAFRLSLQKINWWGTANNLQVVGDPWSISRDVFFERVNLSLLSEVDRGILLQVLEEA